MTGAAVNGTKAVPGLALAALDEGARVHLQERFDLVEGCFLATLEVRTMGRPVYALLCGCSVGHVYACTRVRVFGCMLRRLFHIYLQRVDSSDGDDEIRVLGRYDMHV